MEVEEIRLPDFKLYYKATILKTIWHRHKDRTINKWSEINPEIKPCTYGYFIFDKGGKKYTMEKRWSL